ncbi:MAG: hypothetical protein ACSLE2_11465 [Lysobacterales bacterium]
MRRLLSSLVLVLAAGIVVAGVTSADWPQTVDGMAVYLGVLPAVMVEGHPPGHPEARVAELGLAGTQRRLESMAIAGTETYGGYFKLDGAGPFRITLDIRRPGAQRVTRAEFEYRHPWVAR